MGISGVTPSEEGGEAATASTRALREWASRLELATEAAGIGIWDWEVATNQMIYSPRARAICGFSPDQQITYDEARKVTHPEDYPRTSALAARALDPQLREREPYHYRVVRPDGEVRWVLAQGEAIFDKIDGVERAVRYVGTIQDVTEQVRLEEAEQAAKARLSLALGAGQMAVWELDVASGDLSRSVELNRLLGFPDEASPTPEEIRARNYPGETERIGALWQEATHRGERQFEAEYRYCWPDGSVRWHWLRLEAIPDEAGEFARAIGVIMDVTDRKAADDRLRRSEAALVELNKSLERQVAERTGERNLLATIVETTDAFIQVADPDYRFLAINKASADEFERIFGVRPSVGDSMLELLADRPEHQAALKEVWSRALAGEAFTIVGEFGDPARARPSYEINFNTLRAQDGEWIGAFQIGYDVTERLREQTMLSEAQDALRQSQKMEAIGQLTGGVAHDFNNMLAVVLGNLDIARRRMGGGGVDIDRYLANAQDGAMRAATLTQRLLAFSRQSPLSPTTVELNRLVAGMSELLRGTLGEPISLECVLAGGLWLTEVDPNQLETAIVNLAVNARDAMPDGGQLTIETSNAHLDERYAAREVGVSPGQYVMLAVTDAGSGMTPDVLAKVFDPFFTTKPVGKGTGLGLSMIYGFVKQSGGHVKIYSEVGRGTTVKIYLPRSLKAPIASATARRPDLPRAAFQTETILVVEDEASVRDMSVEALRELGYTVHAASSGEKALETFDRLNRVDVLFTDIVMGGMTGRQLADTLCRRMPSLKVLYTTGYTRNAVVHNGVLDAGVTLLPKPFSVEELAVALRALLDSGLS